MINTNCCIKTIPFLTLLFSSCTTMYIPNAQNTPVFEGKHDVIISGSYTNYQLAYAPTSHLGIFVNGYYRDEEYFTLNDGKNGNYEGTAKLLEGGIGYYNNKENTTFSFYGGWGQGFCSISYARAYTSFTQPKSHYRRLFFQPNFSFGSQNVKSIFSTRLSFANFYDFNDKLSGFTQSMVPAFLEPCFTLQVKLGPVFFHTQLQTSFAIGNLSETTPGYSPYKTMPVVNAGIGFHLNDLFHY